MYVKDDKSAQRSAERLIDADKLKEYWLPDHDRSFNADYFIFTIENQPTVDAIPTAWIVAQIQDTSGAESSYYSRLLKKWRGENAQI